MSIPSSSLIERFSQDRRRQLEVLLRKKAAKPRSFPLSFAQERLWILNRLDPQYAAYNIPFALRLRGPLDLEVLHRAFQEIVARHESLRTRILTVDDEPVQVVEAVKPTSLAVVNLEHLDFAAREAEINRRAIVEAARPFCLDEAPLFRASLLRFSPAEHVLLVVMHHIISDEWSLTVLFRELTALYPAFLAGRLSPLEPLRIQYVDYAVWQRQHMRGENLERLLDYWRERLRDLPSLELPTDATGAANTSPAGKSESLSLPGAIIDRLREVGRREGATPFVTLLTLLEILLHRYSGQNDFAVGSPVAGRLAKDTEGLVGFFVNTLVLRADLSGDPSFRDLLRRTRQSAFEAFQHQELPFERLVDALKPRRDGHRNPLFQLMFSLNRAAVPETMVGEVEVTAVSLPAQSPMFDLAFVAREDAQRLLLVAEYDSQKFRTVTIQRMLQHIYVLAEAIVADPDMPISRLSFLTEAECRQLVQWNGASHDISAGKCIHDLFEAQVERTPDATALIDGPRQWTYRELDQRANLLAHYLRQRGAGPDRLVAVHMQRSAEWIVGLLGILKAGGAYLPLDPHLPPERLRSILEDAQIEMLVTQEALRGSAPDDLKHLLCLDADQREIALCPSHPPPRQTSLDHLAYVIYTSGSTGSPKGVMIEHRALVNYVHAAAQQYGITAADRVLQFAAASFDAHVEEVFPCLVRGGVLVLRNDEMLDCKRFLELCGQWQLTFISLPTGFWHELVLAIDAERLTVPDGLRLVVIGGEAVMSQRVAQWFRCVGGRPRLLNTYGPTEATVVATAAELNAASAGESHPSIGRPLGNARVYVLDGCLQPVPVGVPGELFIGGESLARGYLHRPDLTAERFVPDPFAGCEGARMYKSGDVVRWRSEGCLEFLGRTDRQVKLRGFRIELDEVEAAIGRHLAVAQAAVMARRSMADYAYLAAYVVPRIPLAESNEARDAFVRNLRQFLTLLLPTYMLPDVIEVMPSLPQLSSGKLNRASLPELAADGQVEDNASPEGEVEQRLAGIWGELLDQPRVGRGDDFFALGGHSLLAIRLASRLRGEFGVDLPLAALFGASLLREMAAEIERRQAAGRLPPTPPIPPVPRDGPLPLSYGQEALWVISHLEQGLSSYVTHPAARVSGKLDVAALQRAFNEILRRHESLRTTFHEIQGRPMQVIAPYAPQELPLIDLSAFPAAQREEELRRQVATRALRPIDLARGPLATVELFRLAAEEHVLLVGLHHIVYDGWSLSVMEQELLRAYGAFAAGLPSPLPELAIQYADFAVWQRGRLQGEVLEGLRDYWLKRLAGLPRLDLPSDYPRPEQHTGAGGVCRCRLGADLGRAVRSVSRAEKATPFMTLVSAFGALLGRYSGQEDFAVGTPVAGRLRPETEGLIGYFVNTLVLRAELGGDPSFGELLGRTRRNALEAFDHQEMPFERLVQDLHPPRDFSRHPLCQVLFVLQNTPQESLPPGAAGGLQFYGVEEETARWGEDFDLAMVVSEEGEDFAVSLEYREDLFAAATAAEMLAHFQTLLAAAVAEPQRRLSSLPPEIQCQGPRQAPVLEDGRGREAAAAYASPEGEVEQRLAGIWGELLDQPRVGRGDDFFALGGHSLLAIRLASRLRGEFGVDLPLAALFGASLLREMAAEIERRQAAGRLPPTPPIPPVPRDGPLPLSYSQEAFWASAYLQHGPAPYAIHPGLRVHGPLDATAFERAFNEILRRHESLRTTFSLAEGQPVQVTIPWRPQPLKVVDLRGLSIEVREQRLREYVEAESQQPVDLERGPLLRLELVELSDEEHAVLVGMHHIIYDGVSLDIFAKELAMVYLAFAAGLPSPLPEPSIQYADFAIWQRAGLHGETLQRLSDYWRRQLRNLPRLELPTDRPRPAVRTTNGAKVQRRLPRLLSEAVGQLCRQEGTTKFMTLLAAFQALLGLYAGQDDFAVSSPVTGRLWPGTEDLIGCFINDVVFRADLSGDPSFRQLLGRVRDTVLQGFDHQEMPFMQLVRELAPPRDPGRCTLVDAEFIFQGSDPGYPQLPGLDFSELVSMTETEGADLDLSLEIYDGDNGFELLLCYHADLFEEATMMRLLEHFQTLVEAATAAPDRRLSQLLPPLANRPHAAPAVADKRRERVAEDTALPSSLVQELSAIWAKLLGRDSVGAHDNFFELGGCSILAVQAVFRMEQQFGIALPRSALFTAQTVAELARQIEFYQRGNAGEAATPTTSADTPFESPPQALGRSQSLVLLRDGGPAPPLFCIHGLGGHIAAFLPLALALPQSRPVYGVQGQGLRPGQQPHDNIENMAAFYLREIARVQPRGPYFLAGWSMGGLIALEMSRQLGAAGEKTALVAMLDTYISAADIYGEDTEELSGIRWIASRLNIPMAELERLPQRQQWEWIAREARPGAAISADEIRRLAEACLAHLIALETYVPRPCEQRAILFSAAGGDGPDSRWQTICPKLHVKMVPGNHYSMLRKPHAGVLAAHLACQLS